MGLVLEEDERGNVYIVEIVPGGNASRKKSINVRPCHPRLRLHFLLQIFRELVSRSARYFTVILRCTPEVLFALSPGHATTSHL